MSAPARGAGTRSGLIGRIFEGKRQRLCLVGRTAAGKGQKVHLVGFHGAITSKGPGDAASSRARPFRGLSMLHGTQCLPVSLLALVTRFAPLDRSHFLKTNFTC